MKSVNLDIKSFRKGNLFFRKSVRIETTETTTVTDIKNSVQYVLKFPYEKEKEEFFYMSTELKDMDIVPSMSGNEYIVFYK